MVSRRRQRSQNRWRRGRLLSVTNSQMNSSYAYGDRLGNLTAKDGVAFTCGANKTPQLATAIGGSVSHDPNGNRATKAGGGQTDTYTKDDRVQQIIVGSQTVLFRYDYAGQRVAKEINDGASVTRYYGGLTEVTDGWITKYYAAAGMRIASQRQASPW